MKSFNTPFQIKKIYLKHRKTGERLGPYEMQGDVINGNTSGLTESWACELGYDIIYHPDEIVITEKVFKAFVAQHGLFTSWETLCDFITKK